jgi:hypothetical protein
LLFIHRNHFCYHAISAVNNPLTGQVHILTFVNRHKPKADYKNEDNEVYYRVSSRKNEAYVRDSGEDTEELVENGDKESDKERLHRLFDSPFVALRYDNEAEDKESGEDSVIKKRGEEQGEERINPD